MEDKQKKQEELYKFPYHHIAYFEDNDFFVGRGINWAHEYLGYIKFVLDLIKKREFSSLLDVGCGDGKLLLEASKQFRDKQFVGIDYSERSINLAKALCPDAKFTTLNITNESIGDQFDVVTLIETLEHIPPEQINDFLKGVFNHLKKNGRLIITVPSTNVKTDKKHYQHFSIKSLSETLEPYFTISEKHFISRISKKVELMKKIFVNKYFILNNKPLLNFLFTHYMKKLFFGDEKNTRRICIVCTKNTA